MKPSHLLAALLIILSGTFSVHATPDRSVSTDEILLGANDEAYTVLRNEHDNLATHCCLRKKSSLLEISKSDGKVSRETLLIDTTESDRFNPPTARKELHNRDQSLILGELLERYPIIESHPSDNDFLKRFQINQNGIRFDTRTILIDQLPLRTTFAANSLKDSVWKITEGRESADTLYLKVRMAPVAEEEEANPTHQWICLNPHLTRQVRARRDLEPICLSLGSFATREEAIAQAFIWNKEAENAKVHPNLQIWSRETAMNHLDYLVIAGSGTRELLSGGWAKKIETALDLKLQAVSSDRFHEWIAIPSE